MDAPLAAGAFDPHEFHWALHAVVCARSRADYDALAPLPLLPRSAITSRWDTEPDAQEAPPGPSPKRTRKGRPHGPATLPVFGALPPKRPRHRAPTKLAPP